LIVVYTMKIERVFIYIIFLLSISLTKIVAQEEHKTTTNILFIGNSYTLNNSMPNMFQTMSVHDHQKVNVLMSAKGGHTFQMHANRKELYEDINKQKWDYVILQGFSRELMFGKKYVDSTVLPYARQIVDTLRKNNPCVNIFLYMTWGYENGYNDNDLSMSYDQMTDHINAGYQYLMKQLNVAIVPVGNIWREIRKQYPEYKLYSKDGAHPSKLASFSIANAFFTAIYGRKVEFTPFYNDFDREKIDNIQKITATYLKENQHANRLDYNFVNIKRIYKEQFEIEVNVEFPQASAFQWNFGDKTIFWSKTNGTVRRQYSECGNYLLTIKINDFCGERIIVRNVFCDEKLMKHTK